MNDENWSHKKKNCESEKMTILLLKLEITWQNPQEKFHEFYMNELAIFTFFKLRICSEIKRKNAWKINISCLFHKQIPMIHKVVYAFYICNLNLFWAFFTCDSYKNFPVFFWSDSAQMTSRLICIFPLFDSKLFLSFLQLIFSSTVVGCICPIFFVKAPSFDAREAHRF